MNRRKSSLKSSQSSNSLGKKSVHFHRPLSLRYFSALLLFIGMVFGAVIFIEKLLPTPLRINDEITHPERFIAERAFKILQNLTLLGPRVAGSVENEVFAVNLLYTEIEKIISGAHSNHIFEVDIQNASGAFNLEFLDGMTNIYSGVRNVVVKIGSELKSPHSLLINCHFDSVFDSPGGSDDGASCAVMLEILRVISKSPKILKHNIIFLFNGAEENFLPASHGFITQHRWAREVRSFINMEACGAGGREVLFQAGPNHPWILETYAEHVPYPYASSLAQEIFQSGVVPGDTDYRIFRDFGNISGLDFAWSANGYVYHTKFDSIDYVPMGSLQRTGDNILALARGMAQGHQLDDIDRYKSGNLVFFDFVGAFVVHWPMLTADIINILTVILSLFTLHSNMKSTRKTDDLKSIQYCKILLGCVIMVFISWLLCAIVNIMLAFLITILGRSMSWYGRPLWAFFLYVIPTLLISMAAIFLHAKFKLRKLDKTNVTSDKSTSNLSTWTVFQMYYDAYQLICTVVLLCGTILRIRSTFIALIWVVAATVGNFLKAQLFRHWRDAKKWLLLHIGVMGLPFVQSFYLLIGALYLFMPIMGRCGAGSHAEYLISVMVGILFALQLGFLVPIIVLVRNADRVFSFFSGLFLLSMAVLILTPLGFPYSGEEHSLAPQRFMIARNVKIGFGYTLNILDKREIKEGNFQHTKRTFHTINGTLLEEPTYGYWIVDMDVNSPESVKKSVSEMELAKLVDRQECDRYLYCGVPYLVPVLTMMHITHWVPTGHNSQLFDTEVNLPPTTLKIWLNTNLPVQTTSNYDLVRLGITVSGPANHVGVIISPVIDVQLSNWSVLDDLPLAGPKWRGRDTYFVFYAYGLDPVPLNFTIDLKTPKRYKGPVIDIAVISHFLFGPAKASSQFRHFINKFPSWTTVNYWTSTYESWII